MERTRQLFERVEDARAGAVRQVGIDRHNTRLFLTALMPDPNPVASPTVATVTPYPSSLRTITSGSLAMICSALNCG